MSVHSSISLPGSDPPRGYSDATLSDGQGRLLHLGGHVAFDARRRILHPGELVPQLRVALRNIKATMAAAGAAPKDLIKLTIYTTEVATYRGALAEIGRAWREELGPVYPAMTLVGVAALFDPGAVIEIDGVARF